MKMTQKCFDSLKDELARLEKELGKVDTKTYGKENVEDMGFPYNPTLQDSDFRYNNIARNIKDVIFKLSTAEIVDSLVDSETAVNSHDVITVHMTYSDGKEADVDFYLIETDVEEDIENVLTITISSPIGSAIIGKEIGEHLVVKVPAGTVTIDILDVKKPNVR